MRRITTSAIGLSAIVALALTGCSSKASDNDTGGGGDGEVKTDVGVTDDTITLGVLTDNTGPFKAGGLAALYGHQIWADEVNADGGICGRQIAFDIKDHGYKTDNLLPLYEEMRVNDLGMIQLLGSPMLAALKTKLDSDQMIAAVPSAASNNLDTKSILPATATYDIEMINGLAYMQEQGIIQDGDKIGQIYLQSEAGENTLAGTKYYAEQHDLEVVESGIAATDTDMTSTVTKMKSEGVKVLAVMSSPATVASVGVQMAAQGLNVPLLGSGPTFAPSLASNPEVVAAMQENYYVSLSIAPWDADIETAQDIRDEYAAKGIQDAPSGTVYVGYLNGLSWGGILEQACDDGDLTRAGVMEAKGKIDDLDAKGLSGNLDFSVDGASTTLSTFIQKLDPGSVGGLKIEAETFESDEAGDYKAPYQK